MKSALLAPFLPADYQDTYQRTLEGVPEKESAEVFASTFRNLPWWINGLMKLRNLLVKPFGLKSGELDSYFDRLIQSRSDHEVVWGMDDRHLCFYASVWCDKKTNDRQTVGITTVVKYHNRMGRVYFFFVKPFHKVVIRSMLNRV